jgi:hypothetical protein
MGYYVRVFGMIKSAPTLRAAFEVANRPDVVFTLEDENLLDDPNWHQINLTFTPENSWALLECDRSDSSLFPAEVAEFLERIGPVGRSKNKKVVAAMLQASQFVISCQMSASLSDELWEAVERLMGALIEQCDGLFHVDDVGFYVSEQLLVKTD